MADAIDADDESESSRATRLDAGEGILEHRAVGRFRPELSRGRQECVGSRLAGEVLTVWAPTLELKSVRLQTACKMGRQPLERVIINSQSRTCRESD